MNSYYYDIKSYTNYYPFGMKMPGRYGNDGDKYKYGFNGMESDDEMYNQEGNSYDFGARMYDSRIGRWLSVDPLSGKYPSLSPYNFVANSPLRFIDPNGKEIVNPNSKDAKRYKAVLEKLMRGKLYGNKWWRVQIK